MSTVGYATLPVIPSLRGMDAEVRKQLSPLAGISEQVGRQSGRGFISDFAANTVAGLDQLGGSIVDSVTKWSKRAALAGGAVLGVGLWGGLQRVLDTEDARKTFGQIGLGVAEVDSLMGDLQDRFETGPFAYPDVYDVSSQLAASGIEMDKLVGYTGAVGDLAAFAQEDLARVGEITGVIGAQGRVTATELNRLGQMGVPIRQILAEGLGVSVDEMLAMVSAGELSSDMFFDLISDAHQFDGAMESFADTTRGAWSIMRSGIAGAGEALLAPWFGENGTMVGFLQRVNDYIFDTLQPTLARWGQWLYDVGVPALQSFGETIRDRVMPPIERFADWFRNNQDEILKVAKALGTAAIAVGALGVAIRIVNTIMKKNPIVLAIWAIVTALTYAWQNSETFRNIVIGAFEAVRDFVTPIVDWFAERIPGVWQTIQDVVGPIIDWLGERIQWFFALFSSDGEGGALSEWFETHVGPVMESLQELFGVVAEQIGEAWDWLWGHIENIWDVIGEPVMDAINTAWEIMKDTAQFVWDLLVAIIETALGVIKGIIDFFTAWITGDFEGMHDALMGIWDTLWDGINNIAGIALDWLNDTIGRIFGFIQRTWERIWGSIRNWFSRTWDTLKTTVATGIADIVEWVTGLPGRAWDALRDFASRMTRRGREALTALQTGARERFDRMMTWIRGLPKRILSGLGNLGRILLDAGRQIISGLWDGMKQMWDNVTGWVGSVGGWIADLKGPLSYDRKLLVDQGEAIIGGLGRGMAGEWPKVERLVGAMAGDLARTAETEVAATLRSMAAPLSTGPRTSTFDAAGTSAGQSGGRFVLRLDDDTELSGYLRREVAGELQPLRQMGRAG